MDNKVVFIVTHYGCNSSPSDMWTPNSEIFVNYDEAYTYFLSISPSLIDKENKAVIYVNEKYNDENTSTDYIIIENRVQIAGYCNGDGYCAKRPEGVVIAKSIIKN